MSREEKDKRAGFARNADMAEYACENGSDDGLLVAFWDKKSKGTEHMIETAQKKGLRVKVFLLLMKYIKNWKVFGKPLECIPVLGYTLFIKC